MTRDFDSDRLDEQKNELDCFELLSAYLDGELSSDERKEVQYRLDNEPEIQKMYVRLLRLQTRMQNSFVPPSEIPAADLSDKVFQKIDRTQRRRKIIVWGGAIAATAVATLTSVIPGANYPAFRLAESPDRELFTKPIMLAVAVDKPAVKIPKAAIATPNAE